MASLSPLNRFCQRFQRAIAYEWSEFFWAHLQSQTDFALADELNSELKWAENRKLSIIAIARQGEDASQLADQLWDWKALFPNAEEHMMKELKSLQGPFYKALTSYELTNLLEYRRRWPNQAWQLNQDAVSHGQHSNAQYLHALIRNCGLIFAEKPGRWLTASEMLLALDHIVDID